MARHHLAFKGDSAWLNKASWRIVAVALVILISPLRSIRAQEIQFPLPVTIPSTATALEGIPTVMVASSDDGTERKVLDKDAGTRNRVLVTIVNGRFYWASRENRPLEMRPSGSFTYLHDGPFGYIKFTKLGDKIVYMEQVQTMLSVLTYWGELKIITGR